MTHGAFSKTKGSVKPPGRSGTTSGPLLGVVYASGICTDKEAVRYIRTTSDPCRCMTPGTFLQTTSPVRPSRTTSGFLWGRGVARGIYADKGPRLANRYPENTH